ncbi:MAG TPA: radical SAM protein [Burkholderiales bacterium]|nr:radical SAM protein [Burkholderiales bacterium]
MNAPLLLVPLPGFVQIEPVGRCNLRCRMCPVQYRPHAKPSALLDFDAYCRLLDQFPGLIELHLQGLGEPLMHPRFFDMVRVATQRGLRVSTNTNLTLLTMRRAQEAAQCGLSAISVSIDAATPELFESIRVGARLQRVLRNLDRLVRACTLRGAGAPNVRIVMVLMRRNLDELPRMVALAARFGVDTLFVQRLCHDFAEANLPPAYRSVRAFVEAEALTDADAGWMESTFERAKQAAKRHGVTLRLPRIMPKPASNTLRCDWPWRGAYISYAGEALPCCMIATPDRAKLGNMIRDGVDATWNGAAYSAFRAGLASGNPAEVCKRCALYRGTF